jgi:hypothetical protein
MAAAMGMGTIVDSITQQSIEGPAMPGFFFGSSRCVKNLFTRERRRGSCAGVHRR